MDNDCYEREKDLSRLDTYYLSMQERKPFVTINLRVTPEEHAALIVKKEKMTWEEYFIGLSGIWESRNV